MKIEHKGRYFYVLKYTNGAWIPAGSCIFGTDSRFDSRKTAELFIEVTKILG